MTTDTEDDYFGPLLDESARRRAVASAEGRPYAEEERVFKVTVVERP